MCVFHCKYFVSITPLLCLLNFGLRMSLFLFRMVVISDADFRFVNLIFILFRLPCARDCLSISLKISDWYFNIRKKSNLVWHSFFSSQKTYCLRHTDPAKGFFCISKLYFDAPETSTVALYTNDSASVSYVVFFLFVFPHTIKRFDFTFSSVCANSVTYCAYTVEDVKSREKLRMTTTITSASSILANERTNERTKATRNYGEWENVCMYWKH